MIEVQHPIKKEVTRLVMEVGIFRFRRLWMRQGFETVGKAFLTSTKRAATTQSECQLFLIDSMIVTRASSVAHPGLQPKCVLGRIGWDSARKESLAARIPSNIFPIVQRSAMG